MDEPKPKYEMHILVISDYICVTVESPDMAQRLETEAGAYGTIDSTQGIVTEMRQGEAGLIPVTVENRHYGITIRPTFDCLEVARWLGRGGIVEVFIPGDNEDKFYYPEEE